MISYKTANRSTADELYAEFESAGLHPWMVPGGKLSFLPIHIYFLTFGSMLAEPEVQRALLGSLTAIPPPVPLQVEWWRNVMNRGDLLAFPSARAFSTDHPEKGPKDIPINTPRINVGGTASYYVSRHDRDPSTAKAIREAWCAVATESADCKTLGVGH